jgi:predicted flap endonuclease-1-like 5' DNA nuclease
MKRLLEAFFVANSQSGDLVIGESTAVIVSYVADTPCISPQNMTGSVREEGEAEEDEAEECRSPPAQSAAAAAQRKTPSRRAGTRGRRTRSVAASDDLALKRIFGYSPAIEEKYK